MTRPSPIIVGSVALSILVVGLELYGIQRSRRRAHTAVVEGPASASPPSTPPEPTFVARTPDIAPPPPLPQPTPPATTVPPAAPDVVAEVGVAQTKRPLFVAPEPQRVIRDADEKAFESLRLPEATRAAIRKINEDHAERQRAFRDDMAPPPDGQLASDASTRTRQAALKELLGVDSSQQFEGAERAAIKRLRSRYRWQSLHGVPPGSPVQ